MTEKEKENQNDEQVTLEDLSVEDATTEQIKGGPGAGDACKPSG